MRILDLILRNEYENEYVLSKLKKFSEPKIYTANGDLSKRWYVYYSYRNPETGKLKRQPPIYKEANKLKTKTARMEYLNTIRVVLKAMLQQGYNPHEDAEVTDKRIEKNKQQQIAQQKEKTSLESMKHYNVKQALQFAFEQKKNRWSAKALPSMEGHYRRFISWLDEKELLSNDISELKMRQISAFLNALTKKQTKKDIEAGKTPENVSAKTRNNYRATLSSLFEQLRQDEIIELNIVEKIKKLKSKPKRNKAFTLKQVNDIREYLDTNDPYLRTFIQFITYGFLRNIEVCRLQVKDIDLESRKFYVRTKTETQAIKPIINDLYDTLMKMELHKYAKDDYIFTKNGHPGKWNVKEASKTEFFSEKFKAVKKHFGLSKDYTLYSFRHTAVMIIYNSFIAEGKAPEEALFHLMPITGHTSKEGLKNYLRDIGATVARDYSKRYSVKF